MSDHGATSGATWSILGATSGATLNVALVRMEQLEHHLTLVNSPQFIFQFNLPAIAVRVAPVAPVAPATTNSFLINTSLFTLGCSKVAPSCSKPRKARRSHKCEWTHGVKEEGKANGWSYAKVIRRRCLRRLCGLDMYGQGEPRCQWCGTTVQLEIDHIFGGGSIRNEGSNISTYLDALHLPIAEVLQKYRVLCEDCNHQARKQQGLGPGRGRKWDESFSGVIVTTTGPLLLQMEADGVA